MSRTGVVFIDNSRQIVAKMDKASQQKMQRIAQFVRGEELKTLSGPRTGLFYRVPGRKNAVYQASAPGEAPASPTGRMRNNCVGRAEKDGKGNWMAVIGFPAVGKGGEDPMVPYYLEHGTVNILKRPHLKPTLERCMPQVKIMLKEPMIR